MRFSFPEVNDDDPFTEGYFRPNGFSPGYIHNPHDVRESILSDLEIERRRIREQLLVASDAHKLMMEAGLRIELSLERQMAIVRGDHFPAVFGPSMTRYDTGSSTMVPCAVSSVKDRLGPRRGIRECENFPLIRDSEPTFLELNPTYEFSKEKFEVTFPAETQELFSGTKRKAETPPPVVSGVSDIPSADAKKNRKKEWSCALCKLNFSNVQMLNDHVQGREHLGYHELEQNADESKKKIEKESTSQVTLNIDDSMKENGNLTVQMLKLTNNRKKFMTLSGGVDHESVMNDNRSREKISGEFGEIAQKGGVYVEKTRTHEKETNNTSSEIAVTNDTYCMEQAKPQKNVSGSKRKAETQPLEAVCASKIPSAGAKKNPKQEFSCRPCELFQVFLSNEQINEHMQGMKHKAAERRERFGTGLVSKDINNRVKTVKASCNRNLDQVIQNSEELKKVNGEKNESVEAATPIIDNSMKINGNPVVRMLKLANNNEKFMAPSTSQNDGSQVGKTSSVEQETMISATKDRNIHKLEQAKLQENVSGFKHKADTPPLEVVGASKIPSAGSKKKLKQEFSCALCQVSVSTEIIFNGHIQGKRHKAAERRKMLVIGSVPKDNNSLANISEKKNNRNLVQLYKSGAEMSPRIMPTYPKSVQIDEVVQNSEELKKKIKKKIKKKNELAEGGTQNIDYSKKEKGNLAVQMLERVINNEKFMASSTLLKVESENEKKVDAQNGESQTEKAFSEEEETTKISSGIVGIEDKDKHKLVQENGDMNLKYVSEIGSRTEEVTSDYNKGKNHLEILLEDSQSGLPEEKNTTKKETIKKLGATDNCNSKQNAVDSRKETGEIIELACHANENIDDPKVEKGISTLEIVKLTSSTEKPDPVSIACKLDGNIHLGKLLEISHIGESQAEMESTVEQETYQVSTDSEETKDDPSLEQGKGKLHSREFLVAGSNCRSQGKKATSIEMETNLGTNNNGNSVQVTDNIYNTVKENGISTETVLEIDDNKFTLAVTQNTSDPEKENRKMTDMMQKPVDGNWRFKYVCKMCKVGAYTNNMMNAHKKGKRHLDKLLELSQAENASTEGKEIKEISLEISGTQDNRNLEQNDDESEQEAKGESESRLIQNTCKPEKETNNLTEKTLKIEDEKKRFKFMCRICKVGSNTERVMIAHNSKRSHLEKLRVEKAADGAENEKEKKG